VPIPTAGVTLEFVVRNHKSTSLFPLPRYLLGILLLVAIPLFLVVHAAIRSLLFVDLI
jgi:hypothetical protein